jgi:hypothetical protein
MKTVNDILRDAIALKPHLTPAEIKHRIIENARSNGLAPVRENLGPAGEDPYELIFPTDEMITYDAATDRWVYGRR